MVIVPDFKLIPLTEFRAHAARDIRWVRNMHRHIWITKHGKIHAGVIPVQHLRMLERLLGWDNQTYMRDAESKYKRWRAAKAQQAWEEANMSAEALLQVSGGGRGSARRPLDER